MIRQIVPEEFCLACQGCCRFAQPETAWSPALLEEDKQAFLKNNIPPLFISADNKIRLVYNQEQHNFVCPLLNLQDNKCKAYAFRPFECKLYPFLINRKANKVFLGADLKCPFVKENMHKPLFKEYVQYLTALFNNPDLRKTLKDNPQITQAYEEVLDLVSLEK